MKHADAKSVNVLFQHRKDHIVLIIEDDGSGFVNDDDTGDLKKRGGLGLIGMQERAALLKGNLEVDTEPGVGTTVLVTIPLRPNIPLAVPV
ncbi:MAG: ATP-binding protein [Acidobacteriota bacterium]